MLPPSFDPARVQTPAYVVDLALLKRNLELLAHVQSEASCNVLLALKGFAMFSTFPLVRQYLRGCCASGLHEALLAHQEFGRLSRSQWKKIIRAGKFPKVFGQDAITEGLKLRLADAVGAAMSFGSSATSGLVKGMVVHVYQE